MTMPFINLQNLESREIVPGYFARFVHSEHTTSAYWDVEEGALLPEHSHPHEQICTVLSGEFELTIDGEARVLRPGMVAVIPGDVKHSGKAITACKLLDVFYPIREEYR